MRRRDFTTKSCIDFLLDASDQQYVAYAELILRVIQSLLRGLKNIEHVASDAVLSNTYLAVKQVRYSLGKFYKSLQTLRIMACQESVPFDRPEFMPFYGQSKITLQDMPRTIDEHSLRVKAMDVIFKPRNCQIESKDDVFRRERLSNMDRRIITSFKTQKEL